MPRFSAHRTASCILLALAAGASVAGAQSSRATIMISATVVEASTTPDASLLAPELTMSSSPHAGARPTSRRTVLPVELRTPDRAATVAAMPARYRVTVQLADSASTRRVLVRDAQGVERAVGGGAVVVADSVTASEAVRAPVRVRVGGGEGEASGAESTVRLRYVVTPMESLTR